MAKPKRTNVILRVLLYVCIGFVANLGVCLAIVTIADIPLGQRTSGGPRDWCVKSPLLEVSPKYEVASTAALLEIRHQWGVRRANDLKGVHTFYRVTAASFGFPFRSCRWNEVEKADFRPGAVLSSTIVANGLEIPQLPAYRLEYGLMIPRRLPTHPLFMGMLLNTLVYGACMYGLVLLTLFLRERVRAERGCCKACGYCLDNLPSQRCPECGSIDVALK